MSTRRLETFMTAMVEKTEVVASNHPLQQFLEALRAKLGGSSQPCQHKNCTIDCIWETSLKGSLHPELAAMLLSSSVLTQQDP